MTETWVMLSGDAPFSVAEEAIPNMAAEEATPNMAALAIGTTGMKERGGREDDVR